MITLYELHWSHYCEKIRLALNYQKLPWRAVGIDAFTKRELQAHPLPSHLPVYTVPAIHDAASGEFVLDSTPILRYLDKTYPDAPRLFPGDEHNRIAVDRRLIEFDTQLALPARRFGYTQVILECPDLLTDLFLPKRVRGFYCLPGVRSVAGNLLGVMLSKRFEFHRSEEIGLYEALERYLIALAQELAQKEFVVGSNFSAADIALAAQLRPLLVVPFFAEHPQLATLFERHRQVVSSLGQGEPLRYQTAMVEARLRKPPYRRRLRSLHAPMPFRTNENFAENDQQAIWTWGMLAMPFHYLISLRQGKVRQLEASATVR